LPERMIVRGNQEQLYAILRNLIENAIAHAPPGTEVRIVRTEAGMAVEDVGPGIPAEMREAVFERFARGSWTSVPGTGLGLSIAREAARMMGANIRLEDNQPRGARFVVAFS
jgi:signal transduction histidine kinase